MFTVCGNRRQLPITAASPRKNRQYLQAMSDTVFFFHHTLIQRLGKIFSQTF
jgi:hypothetical protein